MGEAKRRGTREERVAKAVKKEAVRRELLPKQRPRPVSKGSALTAVLGMSLGAFFQSGKGWRL